MKTYMQELAEKVKYHSDLYYNKAEPEVSDAEFDAMVSELREMVADAKKAGDENLEEAEEALAGVGSVPSYGKKVKHSQVMGSLDKETESEKIVEWARKHSAKGVALVIGPKIDGTSLRLNYETGKMKEAATRGDGAVGQDVTDNVVQIKSISKTLKSGVTVEVRGEVYMKKSTYKRLAESGERLFANPRNAAAGSLMAKDPEVTGRRDLDFFVHDVIVKGKVFKTEQEKARWMKDNMPELIPVPVTEVDPELFEGVAAEWEKDRPTLDFEIDGLVAALESIEDQEEAGWNGKRPRGKMAFKFAPEQKFARVVGIDWQVGRTGKLTPMCRIEPTLIAGSTVSNITLHNAAMLTEKDVVTGDTVLIEKAGDIIPQVVRVVCRNNRPVVHSSSPKAKSYPTTCPSCGAPVEEDERGVNLWCKGVMCPAKLEGRVLHYIKSLDILGVGDGIVSGLCQAGYVKDVPDLYYMTMEQVKEVTGGTRAAEKVIKAILEKSTISLATFLDSLGIDGLGTTTSKLVAKKFKTLKQVMFTQNPLVFQSIEGIGDLTAKKIIDGLNAMAPMIEKLLKAIDVEDVKDTQGKLTGKSFCLTGAMSKPRKDIEKAVELEGGECKSSVGKGLDYLVQADENSTSSKSEKAKKCGTKVISENMLWRMMA